MRTTPSTMTMTTRTDREQEVEVTYDLAREYPLSAYSLDSGYGFTPHTAEQIMAEKSSTYGERLYLIKWAGVNAPDNYTWEFKDKPWSQELLRDWKWTKQKQRQGYVPSFDVNTWERKIKKDREAAGVMEGEMLSRLDRKEDRSQQMLRGVLGPNYPPPNYVQEGDTIKESEKRDTAQISSYWSVPETTDFPVLLGHFGTDWHGIAKFMTSKTHIMVIPIFFHIPTRM